MIPSTENNMELIEQLCGFVSEKHFTCDKSDKLRKYLLDNEGNLIVEWIFDYSAMNELTFLWEYRDDESRLMSEHKYDIASNLLVKWLYEYDFPNDFPNNLITERECDATGNLINKQEFPLEEGLSRVGEKYEEVKK